MKKALIIATGGTIVSVNHGAGAEPDADAAKDIISAAAGCLKEHGFESTTDMIFGAAGCDSSDMSPGKWHILSERINKAADEGITKALVIHGTDTMAYTAAWLSLTVKNAAVVLTGSQLTPEAPGFDGFDNVRGAAALLAEKDSGAYICFAGKTFPAPFVHKADAEVLDAYILTGPGRQVPPAFAEAADRMSATDAGRAAASVALFHVFPGVSPVFDSAARILIIEGYGVGNMSQTLHQKIAQFYKNKKPLIIAASSCGVGEKKPGFYGGVGIAGLSEHGFSVFGQGCYSLEFITVLSCFALSAEPDAPEKILGHYLKIFNK